MKHISFTIFSFIIFSAIVLSSSSSGRASAAGEGNTGAPGDDSKVCSTCHNGGNFGPSAAFALINDSGNEVSEYVPGESYTLQLTINTTNTPNEYGFQMVSLKDSDNSDVNGWETPDAGANYKIVSAMGRSYVEHNGGGSSSETFAVKWQAPESGSGEVKFYAGVNAVNGNGSTSGDDATTGTFSISEISTSTNDPLVQEKFELFPNPANDYVFINTNKSVVSRYSIYNMAGQAMLDGNLSDSNRIDLSSLQNGMYIISFFDESNGSIQSKKLIVQ